MQKSILSQNSSYFRSPNFLGNVIDKSQVDAIGKQLASVKAIRGYLSNPEAEILDEPLKN